MIANRPKALDILRKVTAQHRTGDDGTRCTSPDHDDECPWWKCRHGVECLNTSTARDSAQT